MSMLEAETQNWSWPQGPAYFMRFTETKMAALLHFCVFVCACSNTYLLVYLIIFGMGVCVHGYMSVWERER